MQRTRIAAILILTVGVLMGVFAATDSAFATDPCGECQLSCYYEFSFNEGLCDGLTGPEFTACLRAAMDDYLECITICVGTVCL